MLPVVVTGVATVVVGTTGATVGVTTGATTGGTTDVMTGVTTDVMTGVAVDVMTGVAVDMCIVTKTYISPMVNNKAQGLFRITGPRSLCCWSAYYHRSHSAD